MVSSQWSGLAFLIPHNSRFLIICLQALLSLLKFPGKNDGASTDLERGRNHAASLRKHLTGGGDLCPLWYQKVDFGESTL